MKQAPREPPSCAEATADPAEDLGHAPAPVSPVGDGCLHIAGHRGSECLAQPRPAPAHCRGRGGGGEAGWGAERRQAPGCECVWNPQLPEREHQSRLLSEGQPAPARSRLHEYDQPHVNQMYKEERHPQMPKPGGGPYLRVCVRRSPLGPAVGGGGTARLTGPTAGCQGPGLPCQHPAGRGPAGDEVRHLVTLITQCQPGWEIDRAGPHPEPHQGPETQMCPEDRTGDAWPKAAPCDKGTQSTMHSWRLEPATLPRAPWAGEGGSPLAHTGSFLISEAQLRATGLRPEACYPSAFGTAGPQAAWGRQIAESGERSPEFSVSRWGALGSVTVSIVG